MEDIKFSLVVPVYNVEKYINKCLDSIINQSYQNFEVIIVNDGSKDKSQTIIDKYVKKDKRFKSFIKENGGLSSARNYGVGHITGDYLLFIDSDDYVDYDLLKFLHKYLSINPTDLIKFGCYTVDEKYHILSKHCDNEIINVSTGKIIAELIRSDYVETACFYSYNAKFYKENNFEFAIGKLHEDIGLIPFIISKAKNISVIDYPGYYYLQRSGSITKNVDYTRIKKGVLDTYNQYFYNVKKLNSGTINIVNKAILTYLSECLIVKISTLDKQDRIIYYNKLRQTRITSNMYGYNFKKKIKKLIATISFNLYVKLFN